MELIDKSVGATILQVIFKFHEIERELSERVNLTVDEMRCLMTVYLRRPASVGELNIVLVMDPTRTSKVLKSLEKQKLLKRELDTLDRRKSCIQLTENGIKTSEKILKSSLELGKTHFVSISEELLIHLNFLMRSK